jgi:hypothetical protein
MRAQPGTSVLHWRMRREEIDGDVEFIAKCTRLWDKGHDTWSIAHVMFQPEYVVERAVRLGRERRRRSEEWDAAKEENE